MRRTTGPRCSEQDSLPKRCCAKSGDNPTLSTLVTLHGLGLTGSEGTKPRQGRLN